MTEINDVQQSSIIDFNNSIKFQAMYCINYINNRPVLLCFVKLTEKEDYMLSTKCKLTYCARFTIPVLQYARTGHVGELGNLVNGESLKQINSDDEWHSLYKLPYVRSATNTHIVKLEFQVPPLQMSFSAIEDDTEFTDFVLHGTDGSVHMHKTVAAAISPYFKTLFTGKWSETSKGVIEVPNTSLVSLQYLKDYMYRGKIPEVGDLKELLLLSSIYMMEDLEMRCVEKMMAQANTESVFDLLNFVLTHNKSQLFFRILVLVQNGFVKVEQMKMFYK